MRFIKLSSISFIFTGLFIYLAGCSSAEQPTAKLAYNQGDFVKAETEFEKMSTRNPQNEEAWFYLAMSRAQLGKVDGVQSAMKEYKRIAKNSFHGELTKAWETTYDKGYEIYEKGEKSAKSGDTINAITLFRTSITYFEIAYALLPDSVYVKENINALNRRINTFLDMSKSEESVEIAKSGVLEEAIAQYSKGNYSLVIELLKDFPETSSIYDDAIALMLKALGKLKPTNNMNFVSVYGQINNPRNIIVSGYIIFEDLISGSQVGKCRIGKNGYYYIILPSGKRYSYYIDAAGFYPLSRIADFTSSTQVSIFNDNITLVSLEEMSEQQLSIRINNIFFDFNESILKPESFLELDRLFNVLNSNQDIKVEISGHTDNVGSDEYNIKLSQSRSEAVKEYLVKKGINNTRIISKGYGKSNPVATNDTEEGRQLNRRVEFKILKK